MRGVIFALTLVCVHSSMVLVSSDFENDAMIPGDFGCDSVSGYDRDPLKPSPSLTWLRSPAKTRSFVLLVDDMDENNVVHWLVVDIPQNVTALAAGASGLGMPNGSLELTNSFGLGGYAGLCPNNATHQFRFRVFAMSSEHTTLQLPFDFTTLTSDVITAQLMDSNLYCAVLVGRYYAPPPCPVQVAPGSPCPCPGPTCPVINPAACPVPIENGQTCPCPGRADCPPSYLIRYIKPSERLKPHSYNLFQDPMNGTVTSTICNRTDGVDRVQTELSTFPRPSIVVTEGPNSMVEDTPKPLAEQRKRHMRLEGMAPNLSPDVTLVQMDESAVGADVVAGDKQIDVSGDKQSDNLQSDKQINVQSALQTDVQSALQTDVQSALQTDVQSALQTDVQSALQTDVQSALQGDRQDEEVLVSDDVVISTPLGPDDTTVRQCSLDKAKGCKRIRRLPKFSLTLFSPGYSSGANASIDPLFMCNYYHNTSQATRSPPLAWRHIPPNTKSFVMILDDVSPSLDDDDFGSVLWLISNIPVTESMISEAASGTTAIPEGAIELVPFTPPCPRLQSPGTYRFRIFALAEAKVELKVSTQPPIPTRWIEYQIRPLDTGAIEMNYFV